MGIWDFIVGLFGYVMQFCYSISFDNYALALLFYALFFKLLLLPFAIKQQKNQIKMAALRPKIMLIEKKYQGRNDKVTLQKKQQEILELQQREGASALSGCLPMLLQMPIILALFSIIRQPLTFISRLGEKIGELATLTGVDPKSQYLEMEILAKLDPTNSEIAAIIDGHVIPNLNWLGMNFGETPNFNNPSLILIIPFLVFIAQFASMKLMRKFTAQNALTEQTREANISMWIMDLAMPAMTLWFAFSFSAAIGVYWIYQSLLGLLQSFLLAKIMPLPRYTDEEIREMQKAEKRRIAEYRSMQQASPHSLHHIDDDEEIADIEYHSKYDETSSAAQEPAEPQSVKGIEKVPMKSNTPHNKNQKNRKKKKKH